MPGVFPVYQPDNKAANEAGDAERKERLAQLDRNWLYYNQGYVDLPLKVRAGKVNDNVIINLNAQAVDQEVAFFAPKPPEFIVPDGQTRAPDATGKLAVTLSPEQEAVKAFLKDNDFDEQIVDIALSGFITGHSFVRLYEPDNGDAITPDNPPRMTLLDPRLVSVFWDISDIRRVLWYRLTWEMKDGNGKSDYRRQDIVPSWLVPQEPTVTAEGDPQPVAADTVTWWIIEYESKNNFQWTERGRDEWIYPFAPIVHWKNAYAPHEFYGRSDLRHTAISDAANFIASNTARIIRFHAHPRTIARGMDASGMTETAVDGMWSIGEGEIFNLEMQSDLGSSLNYLDMLRRAYFTQMRVVDLSTVKDNLGQITNFGVRMMFKDMLDNITHKRSVYGNGLSEVVRRALVMMGFGEVERPEDKWSDPLPTNKLEIVTALEKENTLQLTSKQTMQEELGRDPVIESERMSEETRKGGDATVDLLDRLGRQGGFDMFSNPMNRQPQRMPMAS
jgi:phage terminase large subunit-like protein